MCLFFCAVKGEIFTGEGEASKFLQIEEYSNFIEEKAGFKPFPGTLNLRANPEQIKKLKKNSLAKQMGGFSKNGKEYGGLKIFLVKFNSIKCCIIEPEITRYGKNTVEVCAPIKIRSKYDLEDGDQIELIQKP